MFRYRLFRYKLWQRNCTTVGVSWPVSFWNSTHLYITHHHFIQSLMHLSSAIPWGDPGQIQLCMGTHRGIWKIILPSRWGKFTTSLNQKPGALSKEIRSISSCLKSRIFIVQKIAGLPLSSWWGDSQHGRPHNLRYCWFVHDVMMVMLVVKNKRLSLLWKLNSTLLRGCKPRIVM